MMISLIGFNTQAELIEVFTTKAYPVALNGLQAEVCALDALNEMTSELNNNEPEIAAVQRVDTVQNARLTAFYRCQMRASVYGVSSLPAIVIDKRYVTYGVRAADKALIASRHYKESHHD
jgi:integrating conjugative element protein (TIGR03757 family)